MGAGDLYLVGYISRTKKMFPNNEIKGIREQIIANIPLHLALHL